jgi:hypothetical protein
VDCPLNSPPWSCLRTQALAWNSIGEIPVEATLVARPTLLALSLLTPHASYSFILRYGKWPHQVGPLMTYMASCDTTCDKFNGSTAKWFKIDQSGKDGSTWYQQDVGAQRISLIFYQNTTF